MAVRYDPLLAAAVAAELEARYAGAAVAAIGLHTEAWTAALALADGTALWLFLHPEAGQIVPGKRSPLAPLLSERAAWAKAVRRGLIRIDGWRWHVLRNPTVSTVRSFPDERLVLVTLEASGCVASQAVLLDLPRNRRNALLLEWDDPPGWRIRAALRPRQVRGHVGGSWEPPTGKRAGTEPPLSLAEWESVMAEPGKEGTRSTALRRIAFTSALNIDYILPEDGPGREPVRESFARYEEVCRAGERRLLRRPWGLQPYVHPLGDEASSPVDSLLDGMQKAAEEAGVREPPGEAPSPVANGEAEAVAAALRRRRRRLRRRLAALRSELEEGESAEGLREVGHLLLARLTEVPRGAASVDLVDFDGSPRRIGLDPALGPAENADRYYRQAARRERAAERLPALIEEVRRKIDAVESGLRRLAEEGESDDTLRTLAELPAAAEDRPAEVKRAGAPERLPYRRYRSGGGLEIRVGRSSRDNDDLTFRHSAPEDIWLHARQVPGAHVVLRWGRRDQNPPERDLREAAVLAAVHSEARSSGVVAVDWTRRKYVRKPRRAAPGSVSAERLRTLFVEPDESAVRRLRADV